MLFEIIIIVIYAAFSQFFVLMAVKFGMKCAGQPEKAVDEPIIRVRKKAKSPNLPKEHQKMMDIMENIDIYDGTSTGQKEIE